MQFFRLLKEFDVQVWRQIFFQYYFTSPRRFLNFMENYRVTPKVLRVKVALLYNLNFIDRNISWVVNFFIDYEACFSRKNSLSNLTRWRPFWISYCSFDVIHWKFIVKNILLTVKLCVYTFLFLRIVFGN